MKKIIFTEYSAEELISLLSAKFIELSEQHKKPQELEQFEDRYYSSRKVQKIFDISAPTLKRMVDSGYINSYKIGKSYRYKVSEILEVAKVIESSSNNNS